MAGAHSHQAGVGAGLLQIVVRPGNHIGVTALEELGVELVGGVGLDFILRVVVGKSLGVTSFPLVHPAVYRRVLFLQGSFIGRTVFLIQVLSGVHSQIHGQSHGEVVLLVLGGEIVKNFTLECIGLDTLYRGAQVRGFGVDIQVNGHGVAAGSIVLHGQAVKGVGQRPGLILGNLFLRGRGHSLHYLLIQFGADMVFQRCAVGVHLHSDKFVDALLAVEVQFKGGEVGAGDDVPQLLVEGVEVAAVGMNRAQQIQGVAVALRLPKQAKRTGVLLVIQSENQAAGEAGGLQLGTGAVQSQSCAVSLDHTQSGQEVDRAVVDPIEDIGCGLLIQSVEYAAAGGVDD